MYVSFYQVNRVPFARYNFISTELHRQEAGYLLSLPLPLVRSLVAPKIQSSPERVRLPLMMFLPHLASMPV
jgi:hypothetical protein